MKNKNLQLGEIMIEAKFIEGRLSQFHPATGDESPFDLRANIDDFQSGQLVSQASGQAGKAGASNISNKVPHF